ncbi:hypothetical protein [Bacillus cabrialesii]|uniref:hypothetical protein n=1 Tax=Bacillus cabrialesii TaxID=2487276 RepID=UPI001375C0A5
MFSGNAALTAAVRLRDGVLRAEMLFWSMSCCGIRFLGGRILALRYIPEVIAEQKAELHAVYSKSL